MKNTSHSVLPAGQTGRGGQGLWLRRLLLCFALLMYYGAVAGVDAPSGNGRLYGELADAFLAGQTHLLRAPDAELLAQPNPAAYASDHPERYASLNDLLIYNGKFYETYGPVPVLLLLAPYKLITGEQMSTQFAAWLVTVAGTMVLVHLLSLISQRLLIADNRTYALLAIFLAVGTFIPYQLHQSDYYQIALGGAYLFTGLGLWALVKAFARPGVRVWLLALGSLCFGLAIGCRANYALTAAIMAFVALYLAQSQRWKISKTLCLHILALGVPFTLCLLGNLYYNYVRFGGWMDFGYDYQVNFRRLALTYEPNPFSILYGLYLYLLHPIPLAPRAPFFLPSSTPMPLPWDYAIIDPGGQEAVYGALTNAPFLLMLIFIRLLTQNAARTWPAGRYILLGTGAFALVTVCFLAAATFMVATMIGNMRYLVDFAPWLGLLACLCYLQALKYYANRPRAKLAVQTAGIALVALSVACGFVIGFIGAFPYPGYTG